MRRFIKNIALFSIPFWAFVVYLLSAPYSKEYAYQQIQKDCRSGSWIHQRLFENEQEIDLAFVGTSRTMCGVQDVEIEKLLASQYGRNLKVANLGVCRNGMNLHYLISRDLFQQKKPKYLILEVQTHLPGNSHFHFPYLAEAGDVLAPTLFLNGSYFSDLVETSWNRWIYRREKWLGLERYYPGILTDTEHSFMVVENDLVLEEWQAFETRANRAHVRSEVPENFSKVLWKLNTNFPRQYYRRIAELCKENDTKLILLHLPGYGESAHQPRSMEFMSELGEVWLPPKEIVGNRGYYFDPDHLNQAGAHDFAIWLAQQIAELTGKD